MGNSASKAAKTAVEGAKRQYPTRIPPISASTTTPKIPNPDIQTDQEPQVNTSVPASGTRNKEINQDAFDPQLGAALRSLGPVRPIPTQSNSSTAQAQPAFETGLNGQQPVFPNPKNNPALLVLDSRKRHAEDYEAEVAQYGRKGFGGKTFLDASLIRQVLIMRDVQQISEKDIEDQLDLLPGIVSKLTKGVFAMPDMTDANVEVRR